MTFRFDPRVRRGRLLGRATLSPAGVVTAAVLAVTGIATGLVTWPWALAAGLAAWGTSIVLHLRDPKLLSALLAPDFDRDLGALDSEHRRYMIAGLAARDRFESATAALPGAWGANRNAGLTSDDFSGMKVRVNDALERLYESLVWSQRAAEFLRAVEPASLRRRLEALPPGSSIADELTAQLEEVAEIETTRAETLARSSATVTGIETLAVKVGSLLLDSTAPGDHGHTEDIRRLRSELDSYLAGLEEIDDALRSLPPQPR